MRENLLDLLSVFAGSGTLPLLLLRRGFGFSDVGMYDQACMLPLVGGRMSEPLLHLFSSGT